MAFTFTVLICLGLSVRPRIPVLAGALPKPIIKAEPSSLVYRGMQVSISCMGTSDAGRYLLYMKKFDHRQHKQTSSNHGEKAVFLISSVGKHDGGQYSCIYVTTAGWSEYSDILELVVTGIFDSKPSLSALPGPGVTSGDNVTLECFSQEEYDRFIVTKEGEQRDFMSMKSQKTSVGQFQALFILGSVTPSSSGTFKCYGYYDANPQVWSEPSDHLEIRISDSETQDHTVENLIRIGMAGLILIILGILLFESWHSQLEIHHSTESHQSE
ncbi:leukocyte immunoglobulin-like receptor subfamily A member 5 [Psammomys obesus]|uniref:leukocyte immunoglobulin-like receptor subfamily A member 5 n=1 Tax=Psammomys obesus TaxID=48139 RepID=UPI0024528E30|nr:leukocyte immunoglobulin-like receptor subfamily A member 5 [Psammomys obesus]